MIIQNKRGEEQIVTPEQWQKMQDVGFAAGWSVISNDAITPAKKTMPKALIDYKQVFNKKENGTKTSNDVPGDKDVQLDGSRSKGKAV